MEQEEEERGIWQERGSEGDKAARGGGMVSAHWVWSGQVEKCAFTPAASQRRKGIGVPRRAVSTCFISFWLVLFSSLR